MTNRKISVKWTVEEDARLHKIVIENKLNGKILWRGVTRQMNYNKLSETIRSVRQCRDRWVTVVDPTINRSNWTVEEDFILNHLHNKHGNKWSLIAEKFNNRTTNAIKNRWHYNNRRILKNINCDIKCDKISWGEGDYDTLWDEICNLILN